jgi:hypothetical protein
MSFQQKRIMYLFLTLGNDALEKNSPLSFFKKIYCWRAEVNKDKRIKTRALMPLIDGAVYLLIGVLRLLRTFNNW